MRYSGIQFRFPTIIVFVIFWTGGKNSLDYLKKKNGNICWYLCSSVAIIVEFYWKFDNKTIYEKSIRMKVWAHW